MLLSYIRENSWSSREGAIIARPSIKAISTSWKYRWGDTNVVTPNNKDYQNSIKAFEATKNKTREWLESIPETRVDVNEACDGLPEVHKYSKKSERETLYESLFVGRTFKPQMLRVIIFEKCTFANCTFYFSQIKSATFRNCNFVACTFYAETSTIRFSNSLFVTSSFGTTKQSTIAVRGSQLIDTSFWEFEGRPTLSLDDVDLFDSWITPELFNAAADRLDLTFKCTGSSFSKCSLEDMKFSSDSEVSGTTFVDTKLENVDLSDMKTFSEIDLNLVDADLRTIEPHGMTRPERWEHRKTTNS